MWCQFLIVSQSDYLIQIVDINSQNDRQTVQRWISWLLQKQTDLDLHCLQRQGISGFSRTMVNDADYFCDANLPSSTWSHFFRMEDNFFEWVAFPLKIHSLIVLGFNNTSTLVGHFVSSPWEREKRDRRDSRRDEWMKQGRKRNRNESKKKKTEEIKTFLLYPYLLQG